MTQHVLGIHLSVNGQALPVVVGWGAHAWQELGCSIWLNLTLYLQSSAARQQAEDLCLVIVQSNAPATWHMRGLPSLPAITFTGPLVHIGSNSRARDTHVLDLEIVLTAPMLEDIA